MKIHHHDDKYLLHLLFLMMIRYHQYLLENVKLFSVRCIQYEDIALEFSIKTKDFHLFEFFDNNYFILASVKHYHNIKCERENNQYLVLYIIDASSFSLKRVLQLKR